MNQDIALATLSNFLVSKKKLGSKLKILAIEKNFFFVFVTLTEKLISFLKHTISLYYINNGVNEKKIIDTQRRLITKAKKELFFKNIVNFIHIPFLTKFSNVLLIYKTTFYLIF